MVYSSLVHAAAFLARRAAPVPDDDFEYDDEYCLGHPITHEVHYPNQGATLQTGELINLSWQSDFNVTGKLTQKWSAEIRDFTNMSFPEAWRHEIFSNVTFNYPSADWQLWDDHCEEYWTLIERNWTIPEDLDLKSGKFAIIFRNETNPSNTSIVVSDLFFIENNKTSTTSKLGSPAETVTVTIGTPTATNGASETTQGTTDSETTQSTPEPTNDAGLSSGVKTGISIGVAALTTLLLMSV